MPLYKFSFRYYDGKGDHSVDKCRFQNLDAAVKEAKAELALSETGLDKVLIYSDFNFSEKHVRTVTKYEVLKPLSNGLLVRVGS